MNIYTSYISHFGEIPEKRLLKDIIDDIRTRKHQQKVQEIRDEEDPDIQKILKARLPYFLPCLIVHEKDKIADDSEPTGLVQMELDADDNVGVDIKHIRNIIQQIPEIVYCFYSPRNGLKFALQTDFKKEQGENIDSLKDRFRQAYGLCKQYVLEKVTFNFDDSLKNIKQGCFMSIDPSVYFNPECSVFSVNEYCEHKPVDYSVTAPVTASDDEISELFQYIDRNLHYHERLPVNFAILSHYGAAGIQILLSHWTTDSRKKLEKDLSDQLKQVQSGSYTGNIGHLFNLAKRNGYTPTSGKALNKLTAKKSDYKFEKLLSKEKAKEALEKLIKEFLEGNKSVFINISTGLGKTVSVLNLIQDLPWQKNILYLTPNHKLAMEDILPKYDQARSKDNQHFLKNAIHLKGKAKLCRYPKTISEYSDAHIQMPWQECQGCWHFVDSSCAYINQFTQFGNLKIMTHDEFVNEQSAWFYGVDGGSPKDGNRRPDFIVVDEDWLKRDDRVESLNSEWDSIRNILNDVMNGATLEDGIYDRSGEVIIDYETMLKGMEKKPKYEDKDQYIADMKQFNGSYKHNEFLRAFVDYIISGDNQEIKHMKIVNKKLHYFRFHSIADRHKDVPTLYLDATANETVVKSVLPDVEFHSIKVKAKEDINVYQLENYLISKKWLLEEDNRDMLIETMIRFKNEYERVGFITYKNLKDYQYKNTVIADFDQWLSEKTGIETYGHFGDLRGRNEFEDVDCLVVIGRHSPPIHEFRNYATAVFREDIESEQNLVPTVFRMKDGSVKSLKNYQYEDERLEMVKDHFSRAETVQAVGRGRLIWGKKKDIYIFSKESLGSDIEVTDFIRFEDYFKERKYADQIERIKNIGFCQDKQSKLVDAGFSVSSIKKDRAGINAEILGARIEKIEIMVEDIKSRKMRKQTFYVFDLSKLHRFMRENGRSVTHLRQSGTPPYKGILIDRRTTSVALMYVVVLIYMLLQITPQQLLLFCSSLTKFSHVSITRKSPENKSISWLLSAQSGQINSVEELRNSLNSGG